MSNLVSQCPSCGSSLEATHLACCSCDVKLTGHFEIPPFLNLKAAELAFMLNFVRSSGSLKEMAKLEDQSYPTIRNRLNSLIEKLDNFEDHREYKRHEILDALAQGKMTADEAAKKLEGIE